MDASDTETLSGDEVREGPSEAGGTVPAGPEAPVDGGTPDYENAAHFAARISHWLDQHRMASQRVTENDWRRVLRQVADALQMFEEMEFVQNDEHAQSLLARVVKSVDLEDMNEQLDRFLFYIAAVFSEKIDAGDGAHVQASTGKASRRPIENAAQQQMDDGEPRRARVRTRMRL